MWVRDAAELPDAAYTVRVAVRRFDGTLGGEATLVARWTLRGRALETPSGQGFRATEPVAAPTYHDLVAAQSRLLERLAGVIAQGLRGLPENR